MGDIIEGIWALLLVVIGIVVVLAIGAGYQGQSMLEAYRKQVCVPACVGSNDNKAVYEDHRFSCSCINTVKVTP